MALFLAGLRSVDPDLIKAAQIDGAGPARIYRKVILPSIAPIFVAVAVVLLQFAIKTFDLVVALTAWGTGHRDHLSGELRLRSHVPARADRDRRGGRDHDAACARGRACALRALDGLAVAPRSRPVADATYDLAFDPHARAANLPLRGRPGRGLRLLGLFRADLSASAVCHRRQFLPRIAGDHAQRPDRIPAELFAERVAESLARITASPAPARASSAISTIRCS